MHMAYVEECAVGNDDAPQTYAIKIAPRYPSQVVMPTALKFLALLAPIFLFLQAAHGELPTIEVPLKPMVVSQDPIVIRSGQPTVVPLNVPLVDRVALKPEDVLGLKITLECKPAAAHIEPLVEVEADRTEFSLATKRELQSIRMGAGDQLVLAGWKSSWHYNGSVQFEGLKIIRMDGDTPAATITLPERLAAVMETPEGRFELIGLANRDQFPAVRNRGAAVAGKEPHVFVVPEASGVSLTRNENTLSLNTNGRGNWDKRYDSAPALVFTPKTPGVYRLEGTVRLASARADQTMRLLVGRLYDKSAGLQGQTLSLYRAQNQLTAENEIATVEKFGEPIAEHTFRTDGGRGETITVDIALIVREWLAKPESPNALIATLSGDSAAVQIEPDASGTLRTVSHPKHVLFEPGIEPTPGTYAHVRDGQLYYGDERLRLWSTVMSGSGERFRALGFNCIRLWGNKQWYSDESARRGEPMTYKKGDGSQLDLYDRHFADFKKHGLFLMVATTVGRGMPLESLMKDDSWIAGGDDWQDWKKAVKEKDDPSFDYIDERLWKVRKKHVENFFQHVNPYTSRRYAEDEAIALVELNNERAIVKRWCENGFDKWPAYFRAKVQAEWNRWLAEKFGDDAAIKARWGRLEAGETLVGQKIKLGPTQANRGKFPDQRGQDFVQFVVELVDRRNQELVRHIRSLAPEGVGSNVVPISFDSQYQPSLPWQYSNALGDTSTVSMYYWGLESTLTQPPRMYVLDAHRTDGKLAVIYETGRSRPSRYRSEYPYALAVLTAWQDFDVVSWHGHWMEDASPEELLTGLNLPPRSHFWTGVHLEHDPTMTSSMALAGLIYRNALIEAAPDPAIIEIGGRSAHGYGNWHGITGAKLSQLTFTRGARVAFRPEKDGGILNGDGNPLDSVELPSGPVQTGKHVRWNWPEGQLTIDSPSAKVYVGPALESYRFGDGITLSGLNTPWVAFALVSADGRPLSGEGATDRAFVSAVFDSANTGLDFDWNSDGNPVNQAKAVRNLGHAPIQVDPVHYTISFPQKLSGTVRSYDFAMRLVEEQPLEATSVLRHRGPTRWMTEIAIEGRSESVSDVVVDPSPGAAQELTPRGLASTGGTPDWKSLPQPLPQLPWGETSAAALKLLESEAFKHGAIRFEDKADGVQVVHVAGVKAAPFVNADIELQFHPQHGLSRLAATYTESASFADLLKDLTALYGPPKDKKIVEDAFAESRAIWQVNHESATLTIEATQVQGVVRLLQTVEGK